MPELPEVESVLRQLRPRVRDRWIVRVTADAQARFGGLSDAAGQRIIDLRRRGKYLLASLEAPSARQPPRELICHLGMTGALRVRDEDGWSPDAYVRASIFLDDGVLDFRDVRRFGRLTVVTQGDYAHIATLANLGPEPLSPQFTPEGFHLALQRSRQPVKSQLLSQRPVAGVGNIYADEALWQAGVDPRARRLSRQRSDRLWAALREVLSEAVEREGTTFRDYQMVNGESGRHASFLKVYGKAGVPCPDCATPLRRIVVGGRGSTLCPRCQRW